MYCWVYIHPQAFYKNLLYCILLSYVLLAKGIVHNDHSLCFYTCVFWNYLVLKEITRTQNLPDYVNKIISAGYYEYITRQTANTSACTALSLCSWGFRRHWMNPEREARKARCCSSHSLTRLEASPADSPSGSRKGLVQAWRLTAGSVTEWERWLAEDWCVTLSGDATKVFRCQSGNVSAFTNLPPCAGGWEKQGVTDVKTQKSRVCHTHPQH